MSTSVSSLPLQPMTEHLNPPLSLGFWLNYQDTSQDSTRYFFYSNTYSMSMACTVHNLKLVLNKFLPKTFFKEKNLKEKKFQQYSLTSVLDAPLNTLTHPPLFFNRALLCSLCSSGCAPTIWGLQAGTITPISRLSHSPWDLTEIFRDEYQLVTKTHIMARMETVTSSCPSHFWFTVLWSLWDSG